MAEFWETNFKEKQAMWGDAPTDAAITAADFFHAQGVQHVLVPGFGYGRNARPFVQRGMAVTGIEISETAIALARKQFGYKMTIHHGSVAGMPFDTERYDGIFCYALLHLLDTDARAAFIKTCLKQLREGGWMVFVTLSTGDFRYGMGTQVAPNTFVSPHGVTLYFHDAAAVTEEFEALAELDAHEINEPKVKASAMPQQRFWWISGRKA